eukprot:Pgem_evm1s13417
MCKIYDFIYSTLFDDFDKKLLGFTKEPVNEEESKQRQFIVFALFSLLMICVCLLMISVAMLFQ